MFPNLPRGTRHHVERAGFGIEREALPRLAGGFAESELAGGSQRETEYLVEMWLVAVPADADPDVVFGTKNLPDSGFKAAECLDFRDSLCQPVGNRFGPPQLTQGVVVAEAERGDPPIAFELRQTERAGAEGCGLSR